MVLVTKLTYEKRTEYLAVCSIVLNIIFAIGKLILAHIYKDSGGGFFVISAIVNITIIIAKIECYRGIKRNDELALRTFVIFIFLTLTSILYILYMARLFYYDSMHIEFPLQIGVLIAVIAFIELILSVRGLFTVKCRGHFFRDIKIINLSGAILSIVLTQIALLSFTTNSVNTNVIDAISGIIAGGIILILAIFILISPKISIVDRGKRDYLVTDETKDALEDYILIKGCLYGRCVAKFEKEDNIIHARIIRENCKYEVLKWYYKMIIVILSPILAIPYIIGAIINYFIVGHTPISLDNYMLKKGYNLISKNENNSYIL